MRGTALVAVLALALVVTAAWGASDPRDTVAQGDAARSDAELSPVEQLGRRLFEDTRLSEPAGVSCASCHDAARAFQGNNGGAIPAVANGSREGVVGTRNTPTLLYAARIPPFAMTMTGKENATSRFVYAPTGGLFWDGHADTLADQARFPIVSPREMNDGTLEVFVAKVRRAPYADLARAVLGSAWDDADRAGAGLLEAIAAFERTRRFLPFRSRFDDVLRGTAALSDAEARGFALFKDPAKGNCISCHAGDETSKRPEDWPFTDYSYSAVGAPRNAELPDNADPLRFDLGLCERPKLDELLPSGVNKSVYCGSFRVPTLRNVAVTAPYMHNGVFTTLRDVVRFYATRDTDMRRWYPTDEHDWIQQFDDLPFSLRGLVSTDEVPYDRVAGQAPRLNEGEIDDVVAFLETLTDR